MNYFEEVKKIVCLDIEDELLTRIVFEMGRYFDSELTKQFKLIQKASNVVLSTPERKILRKKYYYGEFFKIETSYEINEVKYDRYDVEDAFCDCLERLNKYDSKKIISSMKQRIEDLCDETEIDSNVLSWLKSYDDRRSNKDYSLAICKINQNSFEDNNYDENIVTSFIYKTYEKLENYRHMAIVIEGELFNEKRECVTWQIMYKAGIFAENFIQFKNNWFPFKKSKQIAQLKDFLVERNISSACEIASDFYDSISCGYKFEDCYISDNQDCKVLIFKKIELDESPVPCPSCNTTIQRGNSYPEMFLRSYECANPSCPDRSKSGRGKRFDEYGTYRYFKLVEGDMNNKIEDDVYQRWRRDVFDHNYDFMELLVNKYSYSGETILMDDHLHEEIAGRKFVSSDEASLSPAKCGVQFYNDLPIVKLFSKINEATPLVTGKELLKKDLEVINGNSTEFLKTIASGQIGTAITSPPYYNAREYSQWPNMILYYVDMFLNCKSVYGALVNGGYYLYNIGDIVSEDNIYVVSNMSKHRVQLGFLSCMIFELAGYNLTGNIIWDKGEVQSKRSSTINLFSGYVKCINCYEHMFVFRKGAFDRISNAVEKITPVIKINSKGENTYKHTAPYPLELVNLIKPYVMKDHYVLDPFLGSGTTLKWCRDNNIKGVGVEMNKDYYALCLENLL